MGEWGEGERKGGCKFFSSHIFFLLPVNTVHFCLTGSHLVVLFQLKKITLCTVANFPLRYKCISPGYHHLGIPTPLPLLSHHRGSCLPPGSCLLPPVTHSSASYPLASHQDRDLYQRCIVRSCKPQLLRNYHTKLTCPLCRSFCKFLISSLLIAIGYSNHFHGWITGYLPTERYRKCWSNDSCLRGKL